MPLEVKTVRHRHEVDAADIMLTFLYSGAQLRVTFCLPPVEVSPEESLVAVAQQLRFGILLMLLVSVVFFL